MTDTEFKSVIAAISVCRDACLLGPKKLFLEYEQFYNIFLKEYHRLVELGLDPQGIKLNSEIFAANNNIQERYKSIDQLALFLKCTYGLFLCHSMRLLLIQAEESNDTSIRYESAGIEERIQSWSLALQDDRKSISLIIQALKIILSGNGSYKDISEIMDKVRTRIDFKIFEQKGDFERHLKRVEISHARQTQGTDRQIHIQKIVYEIINRHNQTGDSVSKLCQNFFKQNCQELKELGIGTFRTLGNHVNRAMNSADPNAARKRRTNQFRLKLDPSQINTLTAWLSEEGLE